MAPQKTRGLRPPPHLHFTLRSPRLETTPRKNARRRPATTRSADSAARPRREAGAAMRTQRAWLGGAERAPRGAGCGTPRPPAAPRAQSDQRICFLKSGGQKWGTPQKGWALLLKGNFPFALTWRLSVGRLLEDELPLPDRGAMLGEKAWNPRSPKLL